MPVGISLWHADTSSDKTTAENARALRDVSLAKRIGEHLEKHYPGHHFRIGVDSRKSAGIAWVTLPHLLPETFKYIIKLADIYADPQLRCVTRAGGDLLERFNLRRGRWTADEWRETVQANRHVRLAKDGVLTVLDFSTGRIKHVVPDALSS